MARRNSLVTIRLTEVLGDYEWHDREEVIRAVMPSVPPGFAYRWQESVRKNAWLRRHPQAHPNDIPPRKRQHPPDRLIRMGQRAYVVNVIGGFSRMEVDVVNNRIRLHPPNGLRNYVTDKERQEVLATRPKFADLPAEQRAALLSERVLKGWATRRRAANNGSTTPEGQEPQEGTDN